MEIGHLGIDVEREGSLGADKVDFAQCLIGVEQFVDMGANEVGDLGEDADYFACNLSLGLADTVVGLNDFLRFDEDGFA